MKFLIHVTHGPEDPTRAALAFLVAKSALEEGHTVTLFLAGNAVLLLRDADMSKVEGLGTGKLKEHYEAIVKGDPMPTPGIPESFNVLLHELRGLTLEVSLENEADNNNKSNS